ncbi:MAG: penicillin-binding transpeptidase domain-containing protein [Planctomycetota bacterium]
MYHKRLRVFIALCLIFLLACLVRLVHLQLVCQKEYREKVEDLQQKTRQFLVTARGSILDRHGRIIATDVPSFRLMIHYNLTRFGDPRFVQTLKLKADSGKALAELEKTLERQKGKLNAVINKCSQICGVPAEQIHRRLQQINDYVWNLRTFQAWRGNFPDSGLLKKYKSIIEIPAVEAFLDFARQVPDVNERFRQIVKVDIAEMHQSYSLYELHNNDQVLAAQLEFIDTDEIQVISTMKRMYPYSAVAAQTIGWVGPASEQYRLPLSGELSEYIPGELCGREHIEYACETALRGKRGKIVFDFDDRFVERTERQFGDDVTLTLDIELQKKIEDYLLDCSHNPRCKAGMAAVIIDVASGDILVLASLPRFDLNEVRTNYSKLAFDDVNNPMLNRAINQHYPPGSIIKPIILIAALEQGSITPDEVISCPPTAAPAGWPNCWVRKRGYCHDERWLNDARHALKGSCNIYFSHLASRLAPDVLQKWFLKFGYGTRVLALPQFDVQHLQGELGDMPGERNLLQLEGVITSPASAKSDDPGPAVIAPGDLRWFGIGQGDLRVTPLQAANAMAAIARNGLYKRPTIVRQGEREGEYKLVAMDISPQTLAVVRDGMNAVINEPGGTAYSVFQHSGFSEQSVNVFGKTGSTQSPDSAWFAGFAEDSIGRAVAFSIIVEKGQSGASDAASLARDILQFCIDAGYLGDAASAAH